ncbi:hypothetical protein [Paenibacillus sp. CAA11]|uniref:hypothetical protein n=1 Tax=Paenibacillus sp. CAA11 TaxID=1532905 RepID=UPI001F1C8415|nr:hypothetical protein [Paenibacillus sp. CAA11]
MTNEREALKGPLSFVCFLVKMPTFLKHHSRRQQERGQRKLGNAFRTRTRSLGR